MLYFVKWKDEDGTHYAVSREDLHKYFNWKGWKACYPKYIALDSITVARMVTAYPGYTTKDDFVIADIKDWDLYFEIEKSMRFLS